AQVVAERRDGGRQARHQLAPLEGVRQRRRGRRQDLARRGHRGLAPHLAARVGAHDVDRDAAQPGPHARAGAEGGRRSERGGGRPPLLAAVERDHLGAGLAHHWCLRPTNSVPAAVPPRSSPTYMWPTTPAPTSRWTPAPSATAVRTVRPRRWVSAELGPSVYP